MKFVFDEDNSINENEIIIKYKNDDSLITQIKNYINSFETTKISFYKRGHEYFLDVNEILFFETEKQMSMVFARIP